MILILMGVCGSGKTIIGKALAERLHSTFYDGDDFHPESNKEKMSRAVPLTDEERIPWLKKIREKIGECAAKNEPAIFGCSALKTSYREILLSGNLVTRLIHLTAPFEVIKERLSARKGHFFNPALLTSQLDTLEVPDNALTIDVTPPVEEVVATIANSLND